MATLARDKLNVKFEPCRLINKREIGICLNHIVIMMFLGQSYKPIKKQWKLSWEITFKVTLDISIWGDMSCSWGNGEADHFMWWTGKPVISQNISELFWSKATISIIRFATFRQTAGNCHFKGNTSRIIYLKLIYSVVPFCEIYLKSR